MTNVEIIQRLKDSGITPESVFYEFESIKYSEEDDQQLEVISLLRDKYDYRSEEYKMASQDYFQFAEQALARVLSQVGGVDIIESVGGHEGDGEHVHIVIYLPAYDIYLKATADYQSYHGVEYWGDCTVVTPKRVDVTVYD